LLARLNQLLASVAPACLFGLSELPLSAHLILSPAIVWNSGSIDVVCELVMTTPFAVVGAGGGHGS
jgi:hypothetical protein